MVITKQSEKETFAGDKKKLDHFLLPIEKQMLNTLLPLVPQKMTTVQLTLMTLMWSAGIVIAGFMAQMNIQWLWLFSFCIFMQWITDMLDGAVGRARNSGFIKWGFYMDHFLDYAFLASIVIGYTFLLPSDYFLLSMFCLVVSGGFMVHAFLDFAITNEFKISFNRFGVSEIRNSLILFNIVLIYFGPDILVKIFPVFVVVSSASLVILVYKAQKLYRTIDMARLKESQSNNKSSEV